MDQGLTLGRDGEVVAMVERWRQGVWGVLTWVLAAGWLAGCASPDASRFATAAERVAADTAAAFARLEQAVGERRLAEVAADPREMPTDETFAPFLLGQDLTVRMGVVRALRRYATGLKDLSGAEHRPRVVRAARQLERSLRELQRDLTAAGIPETGLTDADLGVLSTVVRRLGEEIGEARRRQALRTAFRIADPAVRQAGALLSAELPEYGQFVEANLAAVETELLAAYRDEAARLDFTGRRQRLREIREYRLMRQESRAFFIAAGRAAARLATAHTLQGQALELDEVDLPALSAALDELERAELELRGIARLLKLIEVEGDDD